MGLNFDDNNVLYLSVLFPSSLSLIFSCIFFICLLKINNQGYAICLMTLLSSTNIIVSAITLIPAYNNQRLCEFQGFMYTYFLNLSCIAQSLIAFSLYSSFTQKQEDINKRCKKIVFTFAAFDLSAAIVPLVKSDYSTEGFWCAIHLTKYKPGSFDFWIYFVFRFSYMFLSNIITIFCYYLVVRKYNRITRNILNCTEDSKIVAFRMITFPLALIFCYFPISIELIYNLFYNKTVDASIPCAILVSLAGFVNFIVYGMSNPNVSSKLSCFVKDKTFNSKGTISTSEYSLI